MKKISLFLFLGFLTMIFISSCSNVLTYAQQLDNEQALIKAYINRDNNNFIITNSLPSDKKWMKDGKEIYYKSPSGLYFHLVDSGGSKTDTITLQKKNTVIPRFKQYELTANSDTTNNWSTVDYAYSPYEFVYLDMTQSCKGFQEAVGYMKRNNSQAKIIVPFLLGFDTNSSTTYGYTLTIKFLKQ